MKDSCFSQSLIQSARVMVVGCGALGNEVLKNLVLMGVEHIVAVDFDVVEMGNLSRSVLFTEADAEARRLKVDVVAERLVAMNPAMEVWTVCGDIAYDVGLGLVRQMDVVIGCVDSRWARYCINRGRYSPCVYAGKELLRLQPRTGGPEGSGEAHALLGHHPPAGTGRVGTHHLYRGFGDRSRTGAGGTETDPP